MLPDEKSLRDLGLKPGDRVWSLEGGRPMQTDADRMRESNGTSWMMGTLTSLFFGAIQAGIELRINYYQEQAAEAWEAFQNSAMSAMST